MLKRSSLFLAGLLALALIPIVNSCNAITGAGELQLRDEEGDGGEAGFGPGSGGSGGANPVMTVEAGGVVIDEIAVYQGVKRPLMKAGAPVTSDIPVVANRDALVRVFASTDETYNGKSVIGRLYLGDDLAPIEDKRVLNGASADDTLDSTLNFDVPGSKMKPGTTFRVELRQEPGASPSKGPSKYPSSGSEDLGVKSDGNTLKIVLVPIEYQADGSKRLPDTSPEQLKNFEDQFFSFYPVPKVEISVHEVMPWSSEVLAFGQGWEYLLQAVGDLRAKDGVPPDIYYYGIFAPAKSEGAYCSQGCVAGLANLAGPGDSFLRAGIGLGFAGGTSLDTAVHEVGHTHGREHSPCGGADDVDPAYPHPDADIGVWGYHLLRKELYSPTVKDVMGYCTPTWISDYTFIGLFERLKSVNKAKIKHPEQMLNRVYDRAMVDSNAVATWLPPIKLEVPPIGFETKTITVQTKSGTQKVTGQWYPYDHIGGGVLVWPESEAYASAVSVEVGGKLHTLTR